MAKKPANDRFSDTLVLVEKGQHVDLLVSVDRRSSDYAFGAQARKDGKPRDVTHSLNWLLGWDEAK